MVDNNMNPDTSQEGTNPVFNEEAVFSSNENSESLSPTDAFGDMVQEASEKLETPSQAETQEAVEPANNDDTRYQYWQSQSDKEKNENAQLRDELSQMKTQLNSLSGQQAPEQQNQQAPVQEEVEFPPPPERPQKPGGYSREEAYSDPSSASARFVDELEEWRDTMDEYNSAKSNYNTAMVQERIESMEQNRVQEQRVRDAKIQEARQMSNLRDHVAKNYSMDQTETNDFIQKMSDPNSISMDNLVQLYRMNKGSGENTPVQQQSVQGQPQPSPTFTQTQRAQQVPQPMGVQPSTGHVEQNPSDQIMDNMISDYKKNNPW